MSSIRKEIFVFFGNLYKTHAPLSNKLKAQVSPFSQYFMLVWLDLPNGKSAYYIFLVGRWNMFFNHAVSKVRIYLVKFRFNFIIIL